MCVLQGVIINGCIRDSEDIGKMPLGVKALGTYPLKSSKRDLGLSDVPVNIAGVVVHPGDWIYADKGEHMDSSWNPWCKGVVKILSVVTAN